MNCKRVGDSLKISGDFSEVAITDMVSDYVKQIEAKCAVLNGFLSEMQTKLCWQESMLARAKELFSQMGGYDPSEYIPEWLSDLSKGPVGE